MKQLVKLTLILAILLTGRNVMAESPWSWEFRTGVDIATKELGGVELGTGFGFEGTVAYRFLPHLSAYAGWGWHHFTAEKALAGNDADLEETGYTFGMQFMHDLGDLPFGYFIRGGGTYCHIELEEGGEVSVDSGHGLGWEVGTGLAIPLGEQWKLLPGVRYRFLSREIEINKVRKDADLSYVEAGVGISRSF